MGKKLKRKRFSKYTIWKNLLVLPFISTGPSLPGKDGDSHDSRIPKPYSEGGSPPKPSPLAGITISILKLVILGGIAWLIFHVLFGE